MASKKDLILSVVLKKEQGKLIYRNPGEVEFYKNLIANMEEGQLVEMFLDANKDDGTLAQIAKVKVCIRALAKEIGESFEDMQLLVKKRAGLCVVKNLDGEHFMSCKSFADCSKEDLQLAITAIIEIGDLTGMNLR